MNSSTTKFAVFDNESLLASLPGASLGATGSDAARGRVEPQHTGGLAAVAQALRVGDHGEGPSLAEALRERYPSSPVVVLFLSDHPDEALRAVGLREMERIRSPWLSQRAKRNLPPRCLDRRRRTCADHARNRPSCG